MKPIRIARISLFPIILGVALAGCSRNPSLDISGSFFPAWMLCIGIGLVATLIAKRIFLSIRIDAYLTPPLLIYGAFMLSATLLAWLLLYL